MGEFIFSICYGGSLIFMGVVAWAFLKGMEQQNVISRQETDEFNPRRSTDQKSPQEKVGI